MNNKIKYGIAGVTGAFVGATSLLGAILYVAQPDFVANNDYAKAERPRNAADCVMKNSSLAAVSRTVEVKTTADGTKFCMYTPTSELLESSATPKP